MIRDLGATGARAGCLTGDCGACSIEIDGRLAKSCLVLAVSAGGSAIVTIEGRDNAMARAVQDAFVRCGGFPCGFCTSGMIMVALELLGRNPDPTEAQIRAAISGNLCRCTGYEDIVRSIASAAEAYRANITNNKQRE